MTNTYKIEENYYAFKINYLEKNKISISNLTCFAFRPKDNFFYFRTEDEDLNEAFGIYPIEVEVLDEPEIFLDDTWLRMGFKDLFPLKNAE